MTIKANPSDQDKLIEKIKAKQENTVWPGLLLNSRGVDEFLWKGSPDAPLVQRLGAWIFGLTFILLGVSFVDIARERQSWVVAVVSIVLFLIGGRVFLNGFKKHKAKTSKRA